MFANGGGGRGCHLCDREPSLVSFFSRTAILRQGPSLQQYTSGSCPLRKSCLNFKTVELTLYLGVLC